METETLALTLRQSRRKGPAKRMRLTGQVPGVIYGRGADAMAINVDAHALQMILRHQGTARPIQVDLPDEGGAEVLVKEIQRNPVNDDILHFDLQRVTDDTVVTVEVPVHAIGTAAGVEEGGVLQVVHHMLAIECQVRHIPEGIDIDVSALTIGDAISAGSLELPNIRIVLDASQSVITCVPPTAEEEPEEEEIEGDEEAMEPEVIGEKSDDDEGETDE